jgi:hypothetical protein
MPKVSPNRAVRAAKCAMPSGKYVDAPPSTPEGDYSPMTSENIPAASRNFKW